MKMLRKILNNRLYLFIQGKKNRNRVVLKGQQGVVGPEGPERGGDQEVGEGRGGELKTDPGVFMMGARSQQSTLLFYHLTFPPFCFSCRNHHLYRRRCLCCCLCC